MEEETILAFDELEKGDDVLAIADDGTRFTGTVDRRESNPEKNNFASVQNRRVHVDGDDVDFVLGAKEVHESQDRNYPGYHGIEDFHIKADGETYGVDMIRRN